MNPSTKYVLQYKERLSPKFKDIIEKDSLEEINKHVEIESEKFVEWRVVFRTETVIPRDNTKRLAFKEEPLTKL